MKVVTDCGNQDYYMLRAVEIIQRCRESHEAIGLRQAVGLLALVLAEAESADAKAKNKR